jgi:glycerate 2-kinase
LRQFSCSKPGVISPEDKALLTRLFDAAVRAADPRAALAAALPARPRGRTVVIGAGKGAAQMAAAFEDLWQDPVEGVIVTRYGYAAPCRHLRVMEASHPVPDAAGLDATRALFDAVAGLGPDDLVVALICGGGSALLPAPPEGLTLEDEAALNRALLASGAPISAMNAIRKQVSRIKGGRLARAAHPAKVVSLVVSDVPGDDPAEVASGPTVPDRRTRADALRLIAAHRITLPDAVTRHLAAAPEDAPAPDDPDFARDEVRVIASAALSLEAAARAAGDAGLPAVILSDADRGRGEGRRPRPCRHRARGGAEGPALREAGGDPVGRGDHRHPLRRGRARRAEHRVPAVLRARGGRPAGHRALAADTDGIDGSEDNAGAFADGTTAARLRAAGHDPAALLAAHDAWGAFHAAGDLFVPGPTGTNVNDFRAILVR